MRLATIYRTLYENNDRGIRLVEYQPHKRSIMYQSDDRDYHFYLLMPYTVFCEFDSSLWVCCATEPISRLDCPVFSSPLGNSRYSYHVCQPLSEQPIRTFFTTAFTENTLWTAPHLTPWLAILGSKIWKWTHRDTWEPTKPDLGYWRFKKWARLSKRPEKLMRRFAKFHTEPFSEFLSYLPEEVRKSVSHSLA